MPVNGVWYVFQIRLSEQGDLQLRPRSVCWSCEIDRDRDARSLRVTGGPPGLFPDTVTRGIWLLVIVRHYQLTSPKVVGLGHAQSAFLDMSDI